MGKIYYYIHYDHIHYQKSQGRISAAIQNNVEKAGVDLCWLPSADQPFLSLLFLNRTGEKIQLKVHGDNINIGRSLSSYSHQQKS